MYWNPLSVVVVLIVITSSASVYLDLNDGLPLYFSDDILVTKIGRISKRSLIKDLEIETTGRERITKREAEKTSGKTKNSGEEVKEKPNKSDDKSENKEESSTAFLASVWKKTRRATSEDIPNKDKPSTERNEELLNWESQNVEESGIVFLPSFGRRTRRNIVERDLLLSKNEKDVENTNGNTSNVNEQNQNKNSSKDDISDKSESDSEEKEESGIVFLPSFGRRTRSISRRNAPTDDVTKSKENPETSKNKSVDDAISKKQKKDSSEDDNSNKSENNSEETQESGIVFLPSFGRRTRSISRRNAPTDDVTKSKENPETSKNKSVDDAISKNQKKDSSEDDNSKKSENNSEETQESGIVFLPSFGRRTRSLSKRSVPTNNNEESVNDPTKIKGNSEKSKNKSDAATISDKNGIGEKELTSQKEKDNDSSKDENSDESKNDSEEKQESSIVFLPSFGRRTRRDTSSVEEKKGKESKSIKKETEEPNSDGFDEDEQESGLVFLPSFGRRTRRNLISNYERVE